MSTWLDDCEVAVVRERAAYCREAPYPPSDAFPEWPGVAPGGEDNPAYRAVRRALAELGLDRDRLGTPEWNPLAELVGPGQTVVLKPNFVCHRNLAAPEGTRGDTDCLLTHGSFVRAVLDYAAKALRGSGRVLVGDCPIQGTRWPELAAVVGLDRVLEDAARRFPGIDFAAHDYRLARARVVGRRVVARDPVDADLGRYREVDLGRESLLLPLMRDRYDFGVIQYPRRRMRRAHTPETNRYIVPLDLLEADLFINLPKMKSHQKAGITCALKNLVGINGHKDYLPHFRYGSPRHGGDEHPDGDAAWDLYWRISHADWEVDRGPLKLLLQSTRYLWGQVLRRALRVPVSRLAQGGGSWAGNDTLWRTVLDINRAFFHYDAATGAVGSPPPRRYLALLDGLIGGERESPLAPTRVEAGLVVAARNPVALDTVAAALMGLDFRRIPQIARAYGIDRLPLAAFGPEDVVIRGCPGLGRVEDVYRERAFVPFVPSFGWKGHVEYVPAPAPPPRVRHVAGA